MIIDTTPPEIMHGTQPAKTKAQRARISQAMKKRWAAIRVAQDQRNYEAWAQSEALARRAEAIARKNP